MPTSSAASSAEKAVTPARFFNCELNEAWKEALQGKRFYMGKRTVRYNSYSSYAYERHGLVDRQHKDRVIDTDMDMDYGPNCCGITELNFTSFYEGVWDEYKNDPDWSELVAKYIWNSISKPDDQRILLVGLPVENSNNHESQYNFTFYNKLLKTLLSFGFKQAGHRYVNKNSKNKLSVLVGQLPE